MHTLSALLCVVLAILLLATPAAAELPSHEIVPATAEAKRNGEAAFIPLQDGSLLLLYGAHAKSGDWDRGEIRQIRSRDGGKTWSQPETVFSDPDRSLFQCALARLPSGDLGLTHSSLANGQDAFKVFRRSGDDGRTWSEPIVISDKEHAYTTGPWDKLYVLGSGRLIAILHCNLKPDAKKQGGPLGSYTVSSDDDGKTWKRSPANDVLHVADNPHKGNGRGHEWGFWEPSLVEHAPGKLLMLGRTSTGWLWESRSADNGTTWSAPVKTAVPNPVAPPVLTRVPGTDTLVLIQNPDVDIKSGWHGGPRRRLAFRTSTDDGRTWSEPSDLYRATEEGLWVDYPAIRWIDGNLHMVWRHIRGGGAGAGGSMTSLFHHVVPAAVFAPHSAKGASLEADVCVYGATSGGVAAAVQAARMGKRVVLVEPGRHLGGMTSGGLSAVDIGDPRTVGGITREFFTRLVARYGKTLAWDEPHKAVGGSGGGTGGAYCVEPHVAEEVFEDLVKEAGVPVLREARLVEVAKEGPRINRIVVAGPDGSRREIAARMFIDTTYEGDLMAAAGVSHTLTREGRDQYGEPLAGIRYAEWCRPRTPHEQPGPNGRKPSGQGVWDRDFPLDPYVRKGDPSSGLLPLINPGEPGTPGAAAPGVQAYCFRLCLTTAADRLPIEPPPGYDPARYEIVVRFIEACLANGDDMDLRWFSKHDPVPNDKYDFNTATFGANLPGASWGWCEASHERRHELKREQEHYQRGLLHFLATDPRVPAKVRADMRRFGLPRDEFRDTGGWPHQLYVREGRRMIGELVMTQHHVCGERAIDDPVSLGSYGIDAHEIRRIVKDGVVTREGKLAEGRGGAGPYGISYRALVPKRAECDNLLVPFALSASHVAFSSIRMEPVFMVSSQSAATAAAMAIDDGVPVQEVNDAKLKARLVDDGQILGVPAPPPKAPKNAAKPEDVSGKSYDLVVIGGTPGGIACAVRAAREGLSVLLVNHTQHLGGFITSGAGGWEATYDGLRSPLYAEMLTGAAQYYAKTYGEGSPQHVHSMPSKTSRIHLDRAKVEPRVAELLFNQMVEREQSLTVLLGHVVTKAECEGKTLSHVTLRPMHGDGNVTVSGKVFADGMYEGDLMAAAGVKTQVGRESRAYYGEKHAGVIYTKERHKEPGQRGFPKAADNGTLNTRSINHATGEIVEGPHSGEADGSVMAYNYRLILTRDPANRIMVQKPANYDPAIANGPAGLSIVPNLPNGKVAWNGGRLVGPQNEYPAADWPAREAIAKRYLDAMLMRLWRVQNDPDAPAGEREAFAGYGLAADEFPDNHHVPYEIYVREARRLVGRYVFKEQDNVVAEGVARTPIHTDSIATTDWPLDSVACLPRKAGESNLDGIFFLAEESRPAQVPYRSILANELDNLLVPVAISASHVGWGSIRLEPVWMQLGESAGHAAALAVKGGTTPARLDPELLIRTLATSRVMIIFFNDLDVGADDPRVAAAEYFGTKGFFASYDARLDAPLTESVARVWDEGLAAVRGGTLDPMQLAARVHRAEQDDSPTLERTRGAALLSMWRSFPENQPGHDQAKARVPPKVEPVRSSAAAEVAGKTYDLVVIGGTPGGIACAVRAAREGLSVLLVQHNRHIGGMLTNGLMQWDALYGGPRSPLFNEYAGMIERHYRDTYGAESPQSAQARYTQTHYPMSRFEPGVAEHLFNRLVSAEKNISVLLSHHPQALARDGPVLKKLTLREYGTTNDITVTGTTYVDATYEGDLAAVAKVPYRVGREGRDEYGEPHAGKIFTTICKKSGPQDANEGRLNLHLYGHGQGDIDPASPFTADRAIQAYNHRFCLSDEPGNIRLPRPPPGYDREEYVDYYRLSMAAGNLNGKASFNSAIVPGENHAYPEASWPEREKIIARHTRFALGLIYFLQNDESVPPAKRAGYRRIGLPLDEFPDNDNIPYELYVREARRIVGRYVFTEHDNRPAAGLPRPPVHADSIAFTDWPMDSHDCTRDRSPGYEFDGKLVLTEESRPAQIPWRSLLPQGVDNLIVPVGLGATHVAWGAVRLEPVWMMTGEAAGVAAALSKKRRTAPGKLDPDLLLAALVTNGQFVTFFNDLQAAAGHPAMPAAQYFGTKGFFADYDARLDAPLKAATLTVWEQGLTALQAGTLDPADLVKQVNRAESEDSPPTDRTRGAAVLSMWRSFTGTEPGRDTATPRAPPKAEPVRSSAAAEVGRKTSDLVVIGGTPAGIACAVRTAREGVSVLLVNRHDHLGGIMSSGLGTWDTQYEGRRSPLYDEMRQAFFDFYRRTYGEDSPQYRAALPGKTGHNNGRFEPHVAERLFTELVEREKRITVLRGFVPVGVERHAAAVKAVTIRPLHGVGDTVLRGKVFVDATYEGDLAALAKVPYRVGRESREEFGEPHAGIVFMKPVSQPPDAESARLAELKSALNLRAFSGWQILLPESTGAADPAVQACNYRTPLVTDPANRVPITQPENYDPYFLKTLEVYSGVASIPNGKFSWNRPQLLGLQTPYVEADWAERQRIMDAHWEATLALLHFHQHDPTVPEKVRAAWQEYGLAKDEFVDNGHRPYEMYVREARRITARALFTQHDAMLAPGLGRAPVHGDGIAVTEWYMDAHGCTTARVLGSMDEGKAMLHQETFPGQLPWRCLLPQGVDNLLVPVCLGATHVAWGTVRLGS